MIEKASKWFDATFLDLARQMIRLAGLKPDAAGTLQLENCPAGTWVVEIPSKLPGSMPRILGEIEVRACTTNRHRLKF